MVMRFRLRRCVSTQSVVFFVVLVCCGYLLLFRSAEGQFAIGNKKSTLKTLQSQTKSGLSAVATNLLKNEKYGDPQGDNAVNLLLDPSNSKIDRRKKLGLPSVNYTLRQHETINRPSFKFHKEKNCPTIEQNPDLLGHLPQALMLVQNIREDDVAAIHKDVKPGGHWLPSDCKALHNVAIIFPFRDRQPHLTRLLAFLLPILKKQRLHFHIIVTEQFGSDLFNKGRLMNAAFVFAEKLGVDCVFFHDVDMFPQDDRTPYGCPSGPFHLGAYVNNLGYELMYQELVGGILGFPMQAYRHINGFSNSFWGWGGEDDDMGYRIMSQNWTIIRPDNKIARYSMIKHTKRKRTAPKQIYKLLNNSNTRMASDGVNVTTDWSLRKVIRRPLYYHLYVDVGSVPNEWRGDKS